MPDYGTLLRDHVTLKCRPLDRIFLQAYVPKLQSVGQVCVFLRWQRRYKIPSSAAFGKIGDAYVRAVQRFAERNDIPMVRFEKGESKEEVARPYIEAAAKEDGEGRVLFIGVAQEKASVWRSWKAKGHEKAAHPHMEWGRQMAYVNHYYFYLWDPEFGGAFWKTNAYAPFPIWLWLNGHEWAKRQLEKAGIAYEALDNGFLSCDQPERLQSICDRLGTGAVKEFFWRWCTGSYRRRSVRTTYALAIRTISPFVSSRSRTPLCSTDRRRVVPGSRGLSAITSTSADPNRSPDVRPSHQSAYTRKIPNPSPDQGVDPI